MKNLKKIKVLVAEDEYLICDEIIRLVKKLGFEVIGKASDGNQAIEKTCSLKPDVVLMDIKMPLTDGLQATKKIQQLCPTPVVILSAHETTGLLKKAGAMGASSYIIKPPKLSEIERAIIIARARHNDLMKSNELNSKLQLEIAKRAEVEEDLRTGRERLKILNKIIRHDLANDFSVINSALNIYRATDDSAMLDEIHKRVMKSLATINNYRKYEAFIDSDSELPEVEVSKFLDILPNDFPDVKFSISGKCKVFGDDALLSVFKNIVTNADKHGKATEIAVKISSERNVCTINFMNNGIKIPDNVKDRIFDEGFYHGKSGHTGIGLHIVKKTIEGYGGTIILKENEPKRVVFEITLRSVLKT
jgi:DNA-binding NarL/FixJ family response regulator